MTIRLTKDPKNPDEYYMITQDALPSDNIVYSTPSELDDLFKQIAKELGYSFYILQIKKKKKNFEPNYGEKLV